MAFTGTATLTYISDRVCAITGLSLAASASGTISLSGGTGEVKLPAQYNWSPYGTPFGQVTLDESVQISFSSTSAATTPSIRVVAAPGGNPDTALWTLTNNSGAAVSGAMTIWVENKG